MTTLLDGLTVTIEILEGRNLVAKDRAVLGLGKKTTSDPYARVYLGSRFIGTTKVISKTVNPVWKERFSIEIPYHEAVAFVRDPKPLILHLFDKDAGSEDDPMGTVTIPLKDMSDSEQWYPVTKGSGKDHCRNATGEVAVRVSVNAHKLLRLQPGNTHRLVHSHVAIGLAWEPERGVNIDMDASCVAISSTGQVLTEETVYYGNLSNRNGSVVHSGDCKTGETLGDDETITLQLDRIPTTVQCLYLILSVVTPNQTLDQIKSACIRLYHPDSKNTGICGLVPSEFGNATSLIVFRMARDTTNASQWMLSPIEAAVHPDRDFGTLIPSIKSYTRDLIPSVKLDPNERIAIMRKDGVIRLRDYCPDRTVPAMVSFGLAWDITNGASIDLDASAICLDTNLNQVDLVYFARLRSNDGAIVHTGDERSGAGTGDDEMINISLGAVDTKIAYIGIVINSYSGQELDDVDRASCHLYDTASNRDIARYALTNSQELDKHTALVMGCLYRYDGEWVLRIISEAAHGRTVDGNVDELQNFLRRNPAGPPPFTAVIEEEEEIDLSMPAFVPHDDKEIVVMPVSDLVEDEIIVPPH